MVLHHLGDLGVEKAVREGDEEALEGDEHVGDELEDGSLEAALREGVPEGDEVGDAKEGDDDEERLRCSQVRRTCVSHVAWGAQLGHHHLGERLSGGFELL